MKYNKRLNCECCGRLYYGKGGAYCNDCRETIRIEQQRTAQFRQRSKGDFILEDNGGDFRNGAFFHREEMTLMLTAGYMPEGAVLRQYTRRYRVAGSELQSQELVRLEE